MVTLYACIILNLRKEDSISSNSTMLSSRKMRNYLFFSKTGTTGAIMSFLFWWWFWLNYSLFATTSIFSWYDRWTKLVENSSLMGCYKLAYMGVAISIKKLKSKWSLGHQLWWSKKHVIKKIIPNKAKNELELLLMEISRRRKGIINKN